jgi:hypothetical protein
MPDVEKPQSVVTPQELSLLMGSGKHGKTSGVDPFFKYRNLFLLVVAAYFVTRALFFPQHLLMPFNIPVESGTVSAYVQIRGLYALVVIFLYAYSYVKDWHFPRVALICASLSFASLMMDFFNIYSFVSGHIPPIVIFGVLIRLCVVYCMFMNSIRDNRAPAMPRTLFS